MNNFNGLPPEKLSFKKKNTDWRQKHIDWAENYIWSYDSRVRKPLKNKIINYNLINGKLDLEDLSIIVNPNNVKAHYIPDDIQHYPIINSKLNVLAGEESQRRFDYRLVVTNPESISEIETNLKNKWLEDLSNWATQYSQDEEEAARDLEKIAQYNKYEWKDIKEIRGNCILKHYIKELSIPLKFNKGFYDAMIAGEEVYQCDIVGGEPTFERINPNKMIVLKSGYSSRIEDADMIVLWDYWNPGKVIDTYYDVLSPKDIDYINELPFNNQTDSLDNIDPREGFSFINGTETENEYDNAEGILLEGRLFNNNISFDTNYTDSFGNIRVVRLYWKSYRKILKVKSYNFESGEEEYNFYPENYIVDETMGEEADTLWINEAWEATKIGKDIYVNMRPKIVQYNRISNPSRCHFGIIGSVYNTNDGRPYSLVDMAKPYNYLYDVVHDRLNKNLAASWGKIVRVDLARIPKGWDMEKWFYFARTNHISVEDSFKEGNKGQATGKLAGMMNNQSSGVIDADQGNIIQQDIDLLQFIKMEMSEVMGITPQREGQVSNRETVGGVERSVLQSSHITEWIFGIHEDVKKRSLECFLETAKVALKGKSKKFNSLLSDGELKIIDIDGDEFAESDYGILVDNTDSTQNFVSKMEAYGQALIQNQMISTSSLFKLFDGSSVSDIRRSILNDEREIKEQHAQEQEAQSQQFQEQLEANAALEQSKMDLEREKNIRDNETELLIAEMNKNAINEDNDLGDIYDPQKKEELELKIRKFNEEMALKNKEFLESKSQQKIDNKFRQEELRIKNKQSNKPSNK